MTTFEYSTAFSEAVSQHFVALGFGPDGGVPHLGGVGGRLYQARTFTMPELEAQLGSLEGKAVLDFGSGTGATAVALAERGADVSAFDVDGPSAELCRMRLLEHGLDHVPVRVADSIALTDYPPGSFDIVLMNAVIEHVPKSVKGLRERVLNEAFAMLRPGGHLVICQSQNRLVVAAVDEGRFQDCVPTHGVHRTPSWVRRRDHRGTRTGGTGPVGHDVL